MKKAYEAFCPLQVLHSECGEVTQSVVEPAEFLPGLLGTLMVPSRPMLSSLEDSVDVMELQDEHLHSANMDLDKNKSQHTTRRGVGRTRKDSPKL